MTPLEYETGVHNWKGLQPVLKEYEEWFHALLERLFYPDIFTKQPMLATPDSFVHWVASVSCSEDLHLDVVERLNALHSDLLNQADIVYGLTQDMGSRPKYDQFKELTTLFEEFVIYVSRLEKDFFLEDSGFDPFTGLRHKAMMRQDISREMERLARQGRSFCLAMVRIDHFENMRETLERKDFDGYVKLLSSLIKLSVRSFDDAYYAGNGVFALCLKQSDINGGISALERLQKELEYQKVLITFPDEGEKPLSISSCIAEPVVGADVDELIVRLKEDLDKAEFDDSDTVLRYRELSEVERFAQKTS
ncbi:MAG: diguanylate cyclase [Alphaproteobacteria bacterium]